VSRLIGRGWASVDLERAADELGELLQPGTSFEDAPRSVLLGARCLRGRARRDGDATSDWIVLLEPDTEGRLAAFLARSGEGWAATWSSPPAGWANRPGTPGPLGEERLSGRIGAAGPFPLLLSAATIDP
jgi:hypothetical protein